MPAATQTLTVAEACKVLPLSRRTIETLVRSGQIPSEKRGRSRTINRSDLEDFFRRCLAQLRAEETARVPGLTVASEFASPRALAPQFVIETEEPAFDVNSGADLATIHAQVAEKALPEDLRCVERFVLRDPVDAVALTIEATIVNISQTGLRVYHWRPLRVGSTGRIAFRLDGYDGVLVMRGRLVWSALQPVAGGDQRCVYASGIEITSGHESLEHALALLRSADALEADEESLARNADAIAARRARRLHGATGVAEGSSDADDQIRDALAKLRDDPVTAYRWFNRARFAAREESVQAQLPAGLRRRDEVLAVWESLGRKVDLYQVCRVVLE